MRVKKILDSFAGYMKIGEDVFAYSMQRIICACICLSFQRD